MATTALRGKARQILARAWQTQLRGTPSRMRELPVTSSALSSTTSSMDLPTRCFSTKKKNTKKKQKKAVLEDSDSDDSDWEDDQEIPFGEPMVPQEDPDDQTTSTSRNLQSVVESGLNNLTATSTLIANKQETKKSLFHKGALGEDTGPTKHQLAQANRILVTANRCLEEMVEHKKKSHPLTLHGHPILIVHVIVNANLREATVYWTLPLEYLDDLGVEERKEWNKLMQHRIANEGGGGFLQRQVHGVLSSYYPPKLKFQPAPEAFVQDMLLDW